MFYKFNLFKKYLKLSVLIFVLILIGFISVNYKYYKLSDIKEGPINTSGRIVSILSMGDYYNKYILKCDNGVRYVVYIPKSVFLNEGNIVSISGTFKVPSRARNKGGFDYMRYLYSQNVKGTIYVYKENLIEIIGNDNSVITKIRKIILEVLGRHFPKEEFGVLLRNDDWRYFIYI